MTSPRNTKPPQKRKLQAGTTAREPSLNGSASLASKKPTTVESPELLAHIAAIRSLGKQTIANVISIGEHLKECKRIVGHGGFGDFLKREFEWTERTAQRFMSLIDFKSKYDTVSDLDLPIKSLYLLAAPSTSEKVREEIIERAQGGEKIKHDDVVAEIKATKATRAKPTTQEQPTKTARAAASSQALPGDIDPLPDLTEHEPVDVATEAMHAAVTDLEELEDAKHRLEMENRGLRSEVAELKAGREHTPELVTVEEEVKAVCSFCHKPNTNPTITSMIKGDNDVAICNECVARCSDIITRKDGGDDSSETGLDPERIQRLITEWNEVLGDIYEKFDPDRQMWATLVLASELYRARKTFDTYDSFQDWALELDILGTEYDVPDNWDSMTDEEQQAWNEAHASSGLDIQTFRTLLVIGQDPDPFWYVCSLRKGRPKSLSAVLKKAEAADPPKPIDLVSRKLHAVAEKTGYSRFHADDKPTILAMLAEITGVLRAEEGDTGPR